MTISEQKEKLHLIGWHAIAPTPSLNLTGTQNLRFLELGRDDDGKTERALTAQPRGALWGFCQCT